MDFTKQYIYTLCKDKFDKYTPSPSTIEFRVYNLKRNISLVHTGHTFRSNIQVEYFHSEAVPSFCGNPLVCIRLIIPRDIILPHFSLKPE